MFVSTVAAFKLFFIRFFGDIANKSQKRSILGFMMVCEWPIFQVITLVGEDWLHWPIGLAGISCL